MYALQYSSVRRAIFIGVAIVLVAILFWTYPSNQSKWFRHQLSSSLKGHDTQYWSSSVALQSSSALAISPNPNSTPTASPTGPDSTTTPSPTYIEPRPIYKNASQRPLANRPFIPVNDTFPAAATAKSQADLPPVPSWNTPPAKHVAEQTPIFIGFTRNWLLLQQTVVSLITAGWPPEDIYVVENTGVMDANAKGQLTLQNPFFLDHHRLRNIFGVNVLITPSLQTFAQLQNFYLFEAIKNGWPHYFWSHMDIVVQCAEDVEPYKSFYLNCVDALRNTTTDSRWGLRYFAYDWVTLMNVEAMVELGGWDTMITYYTADCDLYARMNMSSMTTNVSHAGPVYDSGESLKDLTVLYRRNSTYSPEDKRGSDNWKQLQEKFREGARVKNTKVRNRWQWQQMGGQGEPYYRDMDGFAEALEYTVQAGVQTWEAKWGTTGCSLIGKGLQLEDEWQVESIAGEAE